MSFGEDLDDLVDSSRNDLHAKHPTWERVRIEEVAHLINGFAFKSSGFNATEGMPIVRIRDVTKGAAGTFYRGSISDPKMTFIEDGHIAIGMDGDFNCRVWNGGKALLNQRVCTLQARESFYSQGLLAYALPGYLRLINDHTSSVTVKHLSSLTIRDIPLPLPPFKEQRRIVEKIDVLFAELDKGEESLREVQKLLARYRQSVLKAAVTGQLTADWRVENAHRLEPSHDLLARILQEHREARVGTAAYKKPVLPDTAHLLELPEGWSWVSVETVGDISTGATPPTSKKAEFYSGDVPFLKPTDLDQGENVMAARAHLTAAGADKSRTVTRGAVLVTCIGATTGKTGVCRMDRAAFNQQINAVQPYQTVVLGDYLYWAIVESGFQARIWENAAATTLPIINKSKFGRLAVAVPSISEQEAIVTEIRKRLSVADELQTCCETEVIRSAALRQSILKDAFAGRLVPQDPDDEPASELLARIRAERATEAPKPRRKGARQSA